MFKIPVEVSARHVHLSKEHIKILFGDDYELIPVKMLSQPNTFASKEIVKLINKNGKVLNTRVLGPARNFSQVEISKTDSLNLRMKVPVRLSGEHKDTPGILIKGPVGSIELEKGVMIAKRHLHLSEEQAEKIGIKNNESVNIRVFGERPLYFNEVITRVDRSYLASFHIDTDEGNAVGIHEKSYGVIVKL